MTGTIFEVHSATFADDIGVGPEYAEGNNLVWDEEQSLEEAASEINPNLSIKNPNSGIEETALDMEVVEKHIAQLESFVIKLANDYERLNTSVGVMTKKVEELSATITNLLSLVQDLAEASSDDQEPEEEDLDTLVSRKKGTPGRPVKEPPKTIIPKKVKTKPLARKTVRPKAKVVRKKAKRK